MGDESGVRREGSLIVRAARDNATTRIDKPAVKVTREDLDGLWVNSENQMYSCDAKNLRCKQVQAAGGRPKSGKLLPIEYKETDCSGHTDLGKTVQLYGGDWIAVEKTNSGVVWRQCTTFERTRWVKLPDSTDSVM